MYWGACVSGGLVIKLSATVPSLLLLYSLVALVVYYCLYVGVASSDYGLNTCPRFGFQPAFGVACEPSQLLFATIQFSCSNGGTNEGRGGPCCLGSAWMLY